MRVHVCPPLAEHQSLGSEEAGSSSWQVSSPILGFWINTMGFGCHKNIFLPFA